MDALISCLTVDHTHRSIAAALFVAFVGCYLAVSLVGRVRLLPLVHSWLWLILAGIVGGMTIWCTHFIAMLGYNLSLPHSFDPFMTFLSLGAAIAATTFGMLIVCSGGKTLLVEAGGLVFGLGIGLMHFIGMAGYNVPAQFVWSSDYVAASLILGAVVGLASSSAANRIHRRFNKALASALVVLAIFAVHMVSLAGLTVVPDGTIQMPGTGLQPQTMTFFAAQAAGMVMVLGLGLLMLDAKNREIVSSQLHRASAHDALTGLPNRRALIEELQRTLDETRGELPFAVGFLDIKGFKEINVVHGNAAGDHILGTIAQSLIGVLPGDAFIARAGNDEFAVLLRGYRYRQDVLKVCRRVMHEISRPIDWNGNGIEIVVHAGCALSPADGRIADELVARVDAALLRAKRGKAGELAFYDNELDHGERQMNALALDMRRALEDGEFRLFYQQQHLTEDRTIFGFEVLLRWFHRDHGLIPPDDFIPLAEKTGFISTLGEWVLREACADAVGWKQPYQVGVNVAAQQLADLHFPEKVADILRQTGLPADRLELEFTESGIVENVHRAHETFTRLKALGVKIAMDDFGTGYSSLATLQQFPFNKIKIDRSFVSGLPQDTLSAAIVRSTVIIGKSLGLRVLAEGVETEEQLEFLRREGCPRAQGYYFGKPKPRDEIEDIVNDDGVFGEPDSEMAAH
ncbi:putative bifunctional diguanylate cyclase/phosphodiesterase [Martelella radicis]|uniref:Diguanylate cyclase (GGDEF)-like protein n=1 Tax=Martelella radicis TaxID=1397476 RepID=A0A7W6KI12_9HYPH|nr:EAL domain-containing protein [Martelella radicis]MBB4121483.1 diguanylate cyclase (GGDEF)-like protein [Martelella radicis]